MPNYISQIVVNGVTYDIKDSAAREGGVKFILSTDAASTPAGVTWGSVTGTLAAEDADKHSIYLVPSEITTSKNVYREFVVVNTGTEASPVFMWEQIGDTEADLKDVLIGVSTTSASALTGVSVTVPALAVTASGGSTAAVIDTVTPSSSNLVTTTITGTNGTESITGIDTNTSVTASKATAAADLGASLVTTSSKSVNNITLGTSESVNKVSAGAAVSVATPGSTATVYGLPSVSGTDTRAVVYNMTVNNEVLSFSTMTPVATSDLATGLGSESITPVTVGSAVSVPQVSTQETVNFEAVASNTSVTIPQYTFADVTASNVVSASAVAVAKAAAAPTTVATGSLSSTGTGDAVVTNVTTDTETVVTSIGTLGTTSTAATVTPTSDTFVTSVTGVKPSAA